jgi:hypothetical protein
MRTKTKFIVSLLVTFYIVACEDSIPPGTTTAPQDGPDQPTSNWDFEKKVYIAGSGYSPQRDRNIAQVWGNGKLQPIIEGEIGTMATSIYVSGDDVFLAGYEYRWDDHPEKAMIWKNGVAQPLTDGNHEAAALSIFVSNNDVYVAGYDSSFAILWKNGVPIRLTDGTIPTNATSVFVSNGNVYVVGNERHADFNNIILWKNGNPQSLADGSDVYATSLSVSGNDVYVVSNGPCAMLLKNGVAQTLSFSNCYFHPLSVFVAGEDVYVAGYEQQVECPYNMFGECFYGPTKALVWKNGAMTWLTNGSQNAMANSIAVSGDDVYVVGYNGDTGVIWKNGASKSLGKGNATGIFIKTL